MMDYALLLRSFLLRTARYFPKKEIVSVYPEGVFRYTYGDYYKRVCQLAHALKSLGIRRGDKVASMALNDHRHLELYFGVPCYGAVLHTVNFRLPPHHMSHIINHAEDRVLFVDEDLLVFADLIKDQIPGIEQFVVLSHTGRMPQTGLKNVVLYDDLIRDFPEEYDFPVDLSEWDPAVICYTSATTGDPKGVVYTHRAIVLHSYALGLTFGASESDCILHIVPMFHANAWCAPFGAVGMGCKQVLPGREVINMDKLCRIIADEKVTFTAGVPTIWMLLYDYLEKGGWHDFSSLRSIVSGGAALPRSLMKTFAEKYGFTIRQAYGATETTPLVSAALPKSYMQDLSAEELYDVCTSAGVVVLGLEARIADADGNQVPMDGKSWGEIWLRGPWIAGEYYKDPERSKEAFADGWYHTGDVAAMDEEGYIRLVDRTRDLVKSAGEWISSVDLENLIMGHPKVAEAAIIGIPHPKWQERPLACVTVAAGQTVCADELKDFLKDKVKASWWIPDSFAFLPEIPKTSVGKFNKRELRRMYADGELSLV
ncbi:MAG TPA: long-chain fatty acid--CoA ligase [Deltaproteobacteria bacterium]|jgi:fatty-acyl-CoA synthase|nr:long-chain fatty acid--CoA ligase [Deltaproteobacteria bacterium]HOI06326.1 long-chain fatty acid--CoA ligase [Deltaproteobacteria bacterium]